MIFHVLRFANRLDDAIKQKIHRPITSFSASAWYRKPSTARRRVDRRASSVTAHRGSHG